MDKTVSLQQQFAPNLICFGCGPANANGLQIKSFVSGEHVIAEFHPAEHHQAFPGMLNGGIVGALLDCHMNWTAAWHLMIKSESDKPPCTVTAEYSVQFSAPTPSDSVLHLKAWVVRSGPRKAVIDATLRACDKTTATGSGTFVAVKEGHPAWHRW